MKSVRTQAPGRVNLIGEHTDYNDGFVLPCAIAYETRVAASERSDRIVSVQSRFDDSASFEIDRLPVQQLGLWSDYVRGVLIELRESHVDLPGADLRVTGSVPLGAGLSSSASFQIAVALAMLALADAPMNRAELARLAQRAEMRHAGTQCGIMDQFAVLFARQGHALFLDTRTLQFDLVPVPPQAAIVICNTMVKHELAVGAYNERRAQCEQSVALLRERYPEIRALRDVTPEQLRQASALLPPLILARARHVVTENERVLQAVHALRAGDLRSFGALMYASHESLQSDYAVSAPELDTMVALAKAFDGTIGARMTGGGFGGCTVNLVHAARAGEFRSYIARAYERETGIAPEIYDGTPSAGASVIHG
jgi:galactokinase